MFFNYSTNRIISGNCEWCGIPAVECEHYKDGQGKPLDEKEKLVNPLYVPIYPSIAVEPLEESEKAKSMVEAEAKMKAYAEETVLTQLTEPEKSLIEEV